MDLEMNARTWTLLALVGLSIAQAAQARELQIKVSVKSPLVGLFEYNQRVDGAAADALSNPTLLDFRSYIIEAQKALAIQEGYSTPIYGPDASRLASRARDVRVEAVDASTGTVIFSSHDEAEDGAAPDPVSHSRASETAAPRFPAAHPPVNDLSGDLPIAPKGSSTRPRGAR